MQPRRYDRPQEDRTDSCEHLAPILAAETLRNASQSHRPAESTKNPEEKLSIFWRVFGGTLLSIVALVLITAYQSVSNSINELRTAVSHANEARMDLVKKDDFAASRTKTWDRIQDIQKEVQQLEPVKSRLTALEEQNKTLLAERREMHELHATIKERLTQIEQQLNNGKMMLKDIQVVQQAVASLQEKSVLRDQQVKQSEDERKELAKEIQVLRERLAKVEASKDNTPATQKKANATDGAPNQ